jgi:hypothetical protein
MSFLNLIMGLVLALGCLSPADQARSAGLDFGGQSAKTTAARIHFNPIVIFSDLRGRPLSNAELSSTVREVLIIDKSALQPVIAALALAMTEERAAIGAGLGQAMLAVAGSDPSYASDILFALSKKVDWIAIAAFVAVAGELVHDRAKGANAESSEAGDRNIEPHENTVGSSFGMAAVTTAIARGNTINPALPSSQVDVKPAAPEGALTENHSAAVVTPGDSVQPMDLAQHSEAIKPTKIQMMAVAKPAEPALPTELSKPADTVLPGEAVNSAATEAAKLFEITSPEAIKPMAPRPIEVAAIEIARPVEADRPSATTHAKAEQTKWIFSETTSPVDYSPLVSATIWPRQQVNSGLSGLTISCRAKRIALSLRLMGDLDVPRWGEIWIDSQIGDQRPAKQRWTWDEQQGTTLLYEGDPIALLQSIPDGARLRFGVGDSKGARHMATYHLFGLDAARKKVASACAVPSSSAQASSEKR